MKRLPPLPSDALANEQIDDCVKNAGFSTALTALTVEKIRHYMIRMGF